MSSEPGGELPAKGATVGSAAARMMLGSQLRRFREAAGITSDAAGWHIRSSRSKISRMENGRVGFKDRDLRDLLELYGVTDPQVISAMLGLAGQAHTQEWWAQFGDILPSWFEPYLGLEASASRIRSFDLQFVHGLFQTEAYARAVTALGLRGATPDELNRRVTLRMKRQELLTAAKPPRVWSVVDEAALRRPLGGVKVMRAQLRHLAEVAQLPNVTLQVVPFQAGGHDAAGGSFTILRFSEPDVPDVVYIEQLTGALYLEKPAATDHYLDIMNRLSATSLSPGQTIPFLENISRQLQT
jgi:transcriptional regulator with XRE-family HTH domain